MLDVLKQPITKLDGDRSRFDFKQSLSQRGSSRHLGLPLSAFGLLAATVSLQPASAQETFDHTSTTNLKAISNTGSAVPGSQLERIINQLNGPGGGGADVNTASSGVGTQSQPSSILISQQQLKDALTKKATNGRLPGSADAMLANWGNFSTFLTAGATALHHRNNEFEQGYNATIPSVTLGGGYHISNNLEAGLAFNYSNSNANNNTGGGFNVDSYSPLMYINYLPFDNAFTSLSLGYTRQNQTNNRVAVAGTSGFTGQVISGVTTGNFNANQYNLNFLSGYDHPIENITIGPRLGVDVRQWEMNSYNESTNTGLELSYNSQYQTSIQSTLGLAASSAHSFKYGVLVPQLSASWVHEYANDARTINSHFVQADPQACSRPNGNSFPPFTSPCSNLDKANLAAGFFFQTENPARDWAAINLGASFVMQNGVQVFANLLTVQGNRNFESYGGNMGVRVGW